MYCSPGRLILSGGFAQPLCGVENMPDALRYVARDINYDREWVVGLAEDIVAWLLGCRMLKLIHSLLSWVLGGEGRLTIGAYTRSLRAVTKQVTDLSQRF
jgi:hypothetical protein